MAKKGKPKAEPDYQVASFKDLLLAELIDWAIIIGFTLLVVWPVLLTNLPSRLFFETYRLGRGAF